MRRVYFIKPIGMAGPIKIGCSQSPDGRLSTLSAWSPFPLELLAIIDGDERLERRFHAKFSEQHVSREWFNWSQELADTIEAIQGGVFDISTLPDGNRLQHGGRSGPKPGHKWSDERKASAAGYRERRRIEKLTGLVCAFHKGSTAAQFMADPVKHGVLPEEYEAWRASRIERRAA